MIESAQETSEKLIAGCCKSYVGCKPMKRSSNYGKGDAGSNGMIDTSPLETIMKLFVDLGNLTKFERVFCFQKICKLMLMFRRQAARHMEGHVIVPLRSLNLGLPDGEIVVGYIKDTSALQGFKRGDFSSAIKKKASQKMGGTSQAH